MNHVQTLQTIRDHENGETWIHNMHDGWNVTIKNKRHNYEVKEVSRDLMGALERVITKYRKVGEAYK